MQKCIFTGYIIIKYSKDYIPITYNKADTDNMKLDLFTPYVNVMIGLLRMNQYMLQSINFIINFKLCYDTYALGKQYTVYYRQK